MSQYHKRIGGRTRQHRNARVLAASDVCHICGHSGSDEVDHVVALARGGSEDYSNLRPAHGQQPCPTCGIKCNRAKGAKEFAPVIRRSGSLNRGPGTTPLPQADEDCGG